MPNAKSEKKTGQDRLKSAIETETNKFKEYYMWLEENMPPVFFEEVNQDQIMLIAHNLMGFQHQNHFSSIHLESVAFNLCLDSPSADLKILENYAMYGIKNYQTYISKAPPPIPGIEANLRVGIVYFTEAIETDKEPYPQERKEELRKLLKQRNDKVTDKEFDQLMEGMNSRFLASLTPDKLVLALDMFFRAKTRDHMQYEVRYNEDWQERGTASMQIMLAWRNTPKHNFLYRLARTIHRHGLKMKRVNASYIDQYDKNSILIMALSLNGIGNKAAWEAADIPDFLRELATVKYFADFDEIDKVFIEHGLIKENLGNYIRAMVNFVHQVLVHKDINLYTYENTEEALCRHPELTVALAKLFEAKFDPEKANLTHYRKLKVDLEKMIDRLDTGNEANDTRRKNVLMVGLNFIEYTLKTNFYRNNKTAFSFRLDPHYLDHVPFNRKELFPELPYGIFFVKGMHFFGFQIRFKDLARGGLRTVFPEKTEHMIAERNNVFHECYNLAYTQHKKNKDIPEGGAKGVIFLKPYERLDSEAQILERELEEAQMPEKKIESTITAFKQEQKREFLYQTQRSFVQSILTLVNCEPSGKLKAKHVLDFWKRPEYIYLGPDENMHNPMIEWIANLSRKYDYKPGSSFISSKPDLGINHKEYGVTSLGVNVYMEELLKYMGINPKKDTFTVKISGGPDGDVAGNQILNLKKYYPDTAKILALTDVSGTIFDPKGLDLGALETLFRESKAISFYPKDLLNEGGFLLDRSTRKEEDSITQKTLCWRKKEGKLHQDWLSGSEMYRLYRNNVHQTVTDIFIPAGGRPRTLNAQNISDYLDKNGVPTSKAIVEGANLYLTDEARAFLEDKGVLVVKDSSANKTGVICSSFEVLAGLTLGDSGFIEQKSKIVKEILERLKTCALNEASLLLKTHEESNEPLTVISDKISARINKFTDQLLNYLEKVTLSNDVHDPMIRCFLSYCPKLLREEFEQQLILEIPDSHKKAVIASHIASQLVYSRGLNWFPTLVDILPLVLKDKHILPEKE